MVERLRGGGVTRIASLQMAEHNQTSEVVDLAEFPFELAGTPPNFQYWCRDPQGGGTKFNLSNAITVILN